MKKVLASTCLLGILSLVGCYEAPYGAPVLLKATLDQPAPGEKIDQICLNVSYIAVEDETQTTHTEKKCIENVTLNGDKIEALTTVTLNKRAQTYDIKLINNLEVITSLVDKGDCISNCAITTYRRSYSATDLSVNEAEVIGIEAQLKLGKVTKSQIWLSSKAENIAACGELADENNRKLCRDNNVRPELARACDINTGSVSDERACILDVIGK